MKKIHSKVFFVSTIAAMMALGACKSQEKKAEREQERQEAVETEHRAAQQREAQLVTHIYDSLMNAPNKIDGLSATDVKKEIYAFKWGKGPGTRNELDSLLNARQSDLLDRRVRADAKIIIARGLKNIEQSLNVYNLNLDLDAASECVEPYGGDDEYGWHRDSFVECLLKTSLFNEYGESRKQEIVNIVENGYQKMKSELKKHRLQIAKDFAVYYPELDLSQVPQQYRSLFNADAAEHESEGGTYYEYSYLNNQPLQVIRSVSVYDSKLKPEFFNDTNVDYSLIKVDKGKWQVIKKSKKTGKVIAKTPVFSHNVDYSMFGWTCYGKPGETRFNASAGTNVGVHISVTECLWMSKNPKSDILPQTKETQQRIAKLSAKAERFEKLDSVYDDYEENAKKVALQMAKARLEKQH